MPKVEDMFQRSRRRLLGDTTRLCLFYLPKMPMSIFKEGGMGPRLWQPPLMAMTRSSMYCLLMVPMSNATGGKYGTALGAESGSGHSNIIEKLRTRGAE